jgi:hypothetical protein
MPVPVMEECTDAGTFADGGLPKFQPRSTDLLAAKISFGKLLQSTSDRFVHLRTRLLGNRGRVVERLHDFSSRNAGLGWDSAQASCDRVLDRSAPDGTCFPYAAFHVLTIPTQAIESIVPPIASMAKYKLECIWLDGY